MICIPLSSPKRAHQARATYGDVRHLLRRTYFRWVNPKVFCFRKRRGSNERELGRVLSLRALDAFPRRPFCARRQPISVLYWTCAIPDIPLFSLLIRKRVLRSNHHGNHSSPEETQEETGV